jgi:EAL domain-containing protein (putative c-di-GMP-specific phosphodiesterase class I)
MTQYLQTHAKQYTVLYAEDQPFIAKLYAEYLRKFFKEVHIARDGVEALSIYKEVLPHIVITDIMMPNLDGFGLVEAIQDLCKEQSIIVMSAHDDSASLTKIINYNIDGFLLKGTSDENNILTLCKTVQKLQNKQAVQEKSDKLEQLLSLKRQELIQVSTIDSVTGLFNLNRLNHDIELLSDFSIVALKVIGFKKINSYYGYEFGNEFLEHIADFFKYSLKDFCPEFEIYLYRTSGAHFIFLTQNKTLNELLEISKMIVRLFNKHEFTIDSNPMSFELAVGIAYEKGPNILSRAESALTVAEAMDTKIYAMTHEEYIQNKHSKVFIERKNLIKRALEQNRIVPYYQAIIDNSTLQIIKYESLMRIISPNGSIVAPMEFLEAAKQSGFYLQMTRMIIEKTLEDFSSLPYTVSLNLSMEDIASQKTQKFILDKVASFIDPSRLVFELVESEHIQSFEMVNSFFTKLKNFGCKIAIDDFGSGYSNFEYILGLRPDYIKFDGSLIKDIETNKEAKLVVEMLVSLAKKVGMKTIAEYVSLDSILCIVKDIGVDESQGYFIGKPQPFNNLDWKISISQIQKS